MNKEAGEEGGGVSGERNRNFCSGFCRGAREILRCECDRKGMVAFFSNRQHRYHAIDFN